MKNWKTTLAGLFAGFGTIGPMFGLKPEISAAISTIGVTLMGIFSKDSNVTGGTVAQ